MSKVRFSMDRDSSEDGDDISMIWEDQKPPLTIDNATTTTTTVVSASTLGLSQRKALPCFLCGSEEARVHQHRHTSLTLIKELGICFEQFLEFPKDDLQDYMKRCGPLENWVPLCDKCRPLINEGRELKEQVESLEKRMSDHQQLIVKKVKCSRVNFSGNAATGDNDNAAESLRSLDSMRKYVKAKKYPPDKYKMVAIKTIVKKIVKLPPEKPPIPKSSIEKKKPLKTYSTSKKEPKPSKASSKKTVKIQKAPDPCPRQTRKSAAAAATTTDEILIDIDCDDDSVINLKVGPLSPQSDSAPSKTLLCKLCDDGASVFASEKLLIAHQKKVHGPKKMPATTRKRKQPEVAAKVKKTAAAASTKTGKNVGEVEVDVSNDNKKNGKTQDQATDKQKETNDLKRPSADEDEEGLAAPRKKKKLTKYKSPRSYVKYRYSCPNCPKVKGYWLNRYAQHLAIHQRRPYRCSECLEFLPNEEALQDQHWKDKHADKEIPTDYEKFVKIKMDPGKIYKCYGCYIGFSSEDERNTHEPKCRKIIKSRRTVFKKEEPMTCQTCSKNFRNINEWRLHRVLEHPELDSLSCFMCDKSFSAVVVGGGDGVVARDDFKFLDHLRTDHPVRERCDTRFYEECEDCGVVFHGGGKKLVKKNHILKEHRERVFQDDELYPCKYCLDKSFNSAPTLRLHMAMEHFQHSFVNSYANTSTGVKKYVMASTPSLCDNCGKYFKSKWSLQHHNYSQHGVIPEGAQIINCPKEGCQFKSVVRGSVTDHHHRAHILSITRPYKCKYCPKGCRSTVELKLHHQSHENKETRPFVCDQCGASFAVQKNLQNHTQYVHEKKPYPPSSKNRKRRPPKKK